MAAGCDAGAPGVTTRHVGLVLLHPFLISFFQRAAVLSPGAAKIDAGLNERAAALLHFLATGDDNVPERDLGFIKVLLGMRPDDPLPVAGGLITEADRQLAASLLQAVPERWTMLGKTSTDGLRETFLQRGGLLQKLEAGWRLEVERRAFDVLLIGVPWAISRVELPWMARPIFTEWSA
jgi:hypothetical protein